MQACFALASMVTAVRSAEAHPDLYFGVEDVDALRMRGQDATPQPGGWSYADVLASFVAAADVTIATPYSYTVEIPDIDGSGSATWTYTLSAAMPPPHPNNPSYPPWTKVSRDLENRLVLLAFAWLMTGDEAYLRNEQQTGAVDTAKMLAQWSQWTDPYYSCGAACLDTAHLTFGAATLYDFAYDALTEDERAAVRSAIAELGVAPLAQEIQTTPDEAWFNGYALRVSGLAVGISAIAPELGSAADDWLALADASSRGFMDGQGSDGGTFEGQLYGAYAVDRLVQGLAALERRGFDGLFDDPWLRDLPRFAAAFLASDLRSAAPIGDSSEVVYWTATAAALAAHGDGHGQWYLDLVERQKPTGVLTFIWSSPDVVPEPIVGSGSAAFVDVGHAALRAGFDDAPVVTVKSGPTDVLVGHGHYDANSFTISAHGQWIADDPGYRDYFNPSRSTYTAQTIGHNTIMVDKTVAAGGGSTTGGQDALVGGELAYFFEGSGYAKVVARAAATYDPSLLSRFDRRIFYAKPDVVFVFDDLASPSARAYSWLLHAPPDGRWSAATAGPAEAVLQRGVARLDTHLVASVALSGDAPVFTSHPGAESYGAYAEWRTVPASAARIAAVLVPARHAVLDAPNPGFEDGMLDWQPRRTDASHAIDDAVAHGGSKSARIEFDTDDDGYFYSSPVTVTALGTFSARAHARTEGASGEVAIQAYWLQNGAYLADPAGPRTAVDAAGLAEFTAIDLAGEVPEGVDELRLALEFGGSGTVWFDDVSISASDVVAPDPATHAVALGDPALGIAVEGGFGVHAGASRLGSGITGAIELAATDASIAAVPSLGSDADVFLVGLDPQGRLTHAFVQGGRTIAIAGTEQVGLAATGSLDVGVVYDAQDCGRVELTQYPSGEAPPYRVRGEIGEVWLDGTRVAFERDGDHVVFPAGADLGPGCLPPAGGDSSGDGGADTSAGEGGGGDTGTSPATSSGSEGTGPGEHSSEAGCGCAAVPSGTSSLPWLAITALVRRRRFRVRQRAPIIRSR